MRSPQAGMEDKETGDPEVIFVGRKVSIESRKSDRRADGSEASLCLHLGVLVSDKVRPGPHNGFFLGVFQELRRRPRTS